jgi:glutathione S-transferase
VNIATLSGINLDQFPNVQKWWERVEARPAVQKGLEIPNGPSAFGNRGVQQKIRDDPESAEKHKEFQELVQKSKEQYDYKFAPV